MLRQPCTFPALRTIVVLCVTSMLASPACLIAAAQPAMADIGDCGRPTSSGDAPTATDALFTLRTSVGSQTCDLCTCDANDDGNVSATDALILLRAAVGQTVDIFCAPLCYSFTCEPGNDEDADGLTDCQEVEQTGTNPFIEDTDGDGLTDGQEIFEFAFDPVANPFLFNPRIADVPQLSFVLTTAPEINVIGELGSGQTFESGTRDLSASERTYSTSKTDTESHRTEMTVSAELSFENVVKKMVPPKSVSPARAVTDTLGGALGFSRTTSDETSVSFTSTSSSAMRNESEVTKNEITEMSVTNTEGVIEVAADIQNIGNQTFGVSEFGLSVLKRDSTDRTSFSPVTQLGKAVFNRNDDGDFPTLAPGQKITNQIFSSNTGADIIEVTAQQALDLLADPSGLVLNVSTYELEVVVNRGAGIEPVRIPWSANEQLVQQKTAAVIVDYGPPPFPAQERFLVATNVHFNGDIHSVPTPLGIPVREVLRDILGFDYETEVLEVRDAATDAVTGRVRRLVSLTRPNGQGTFSADESIGSAWSVWTDAASVQVFDDTTFSSTMDPFNDFEDILLRKGNRLHLVYTEDRDLDGMGKREEFLYGTSDTDPDSDDDGLSDFGEARTGWSIEVVGMEPYQSFSNPTVVDTDEDGLDDEMEMMIGTDAQVVDTDMDAATDAEEIDFGSDPLDPDDPPFPLDAVVSFSFDDYDPANGFVPDDSGNGNDGALITSGPNAFNVVNVPDRFGQVDRAVKFERDANTAGIIDVGERPEIDGPLTIALWIESGHGFLFGTRGRVGESATLELEVSGSSLLTLTVRDRDDLASSMTFTDPTSIPSSGWVHVAFVIDYDEGSGTSTLTYYRDGEVVEGVGGGFPWRVDNDPATTEMSVGARFNCSTSSASPCYCNAIISATACSNLQNSSGWNGLMDEFRLYARPLNSAEVSDLYHEGGWPLP
jgi:hypothetical protein